MVQDMDRGTYVYCLIADRRPPSLDRLPRGLASTSPVRLIEIDETGSRIRRAGGAARPPTKWLVVSDAPLDVYGEDAINRKMSDLDWVSRAAIAHEAVIEAFAPAAAVLPMKLFTIFTSDARAVAHVASRRRGIDAVLKRVTKHDEWGLRVAMPRARAAAPRVTGDQRETGKSGAAYLRGKKAQWDAGAQLAGRARAATEGLHRRLAKLARSAVRRAATEMPRDGGTLLLDAAYLVPRRSSRRFQAAVSREARALDRDGYVVSFSGPWPPYSFMQN